MTFNFRTSACSSVLASGQHIDKFQEYQARMVPDLHFVCIPSSFLRGKSCHKKTFEVDVFLSRGRLNIDSSKTDVVALRAYS